MVKHVILWTIKEEYQGEERRKIIEGIKTGLESLSGKIPGMISIKVNIDKLPSSNVDLMLDSSFESEEALKNYSVHPEHVAIANANVRPYTSTRNCLDFKE